MNQREAVFDVISTTVDITEGQPVVLTKEQKATVVAKLMEKFDNGEVEFSDKTKDKYVGDAAVKHYVSGLVSNWLKKDSRLNGGNKYKPATTSTRTTDETLKTMQALRKQLVAAGDDAKVAEVDEAITVHVNSTKKAKAKTITKTIKPEVDMSAVPAELKTLLGI